MSEEPSKQTTQVLTPQTIQAGLGTILATLGNLIWTGRAAEAASSLAPLISFVAIWLGARLVRQWDARSEAQKPTLQLRNLLRETEKKISVCDANAPERKQLQRQAAGLREAIYRKVLDGAEVVELKPSVEVIPEALPPAT